METDVKQAPVSEEATEETQVVPETTEETQEPEETQTPKAGDKTDPNLLLKSLQEEREKRRQIEEELLEIKRVQTEPTYDDEDRIARLERTLKEIQYKEQVSQILLKYPEIKDLRSEFEDYAKEYPSTQIENVAKLFLVEKGLIGSSRKGLERTTGGTKQPQQSGMSADDVKTLRETNFRKYQQMLMDGKIKDIK